MASTKAPLFGLDASGTIAKSIVFSKWRGRTYVRRHAVPSNPKSDLQVGMRAVFAFISSNWGSLSQAQKDAWNALAAIDNITQLNAMMRDAQTRARNNQGWRRGPSEAAGTTPGAPTLDSVTAGRGSVTVNWTPDGLQPGEWTAAVYVDTAAGVTAVINNLRRIVPIANNSAVVTGLKAGTTYYFKVLETNFDGELGTLSNELSATPT